MSASPRKTTQWLLICGTPPKDQRPHPPKDQKGTHPSLHCDCVGAQVPCARCLCSPLCASPVPVLARLQRPHTVPRLPLAARCFWSRCALQPSRSGTRSTALHSMGCRFCCYSLWGPDFLIACYATLLSMFRSPNPDVLRMRSSA